MPPLARNFISSTGGGGKPVLCGGKVSRFFKNFFARNAGVVRDFVVFRKIEKKFSKKLLHLVKVCAIMIPVPRYFSQFSQKEKEKWKRKK